MKVIKSAALEQCFIGAFCCSRIRTLVVLRTILVCLFLLPAVSCVNSLQPVDASLKPDADTVVIYGRFELEQNQDIPGSKICLSLYNLDTRREFFLPLRRINPVYCTRIQSGTYEITGCALVGGWWGPNRQAFSGKDGPMVIPFKAEPGSAVYIGDFGGYGSVENPYPYYISFGMRHATNNFAATTEAFHSLYPNLAKLPVVSILQPTQNPIP